MKLIPVGPYYVNPEAIASLTSIPGKKTSLVLCGGNELIIEIPVNQVVSEICAKTGQKASEVIG